MARNDEGLNEMKREINRILDTLMDVFLVPCGSRVIGIMLGRIILVLEFYLVSINKASLLLLQHIWSMFTGLMGVFMVSFEIFTPFYRPKSRSLIRNAQFKLICC